MPTRETEINAGVGPAAKQVAEHASSLARLELELAILELKKKVAALGIGIGLGLGALLFVLFGIGFAFATIAAALATAVSTWLALLITTAILLGLSGVLAVVAVVLLRKGTPVPRQAIEEAKLTTEALKSDGSA
ncbi:MAG: phage holin family protein [Actinobacteria bacterium]|nr:MAG: phage holin family protein [Actinomycetota bacterium]